MDTQHALTAILPCSDLDASLAFYRRLGFTLLSEYSPAPGQKPHYRILHDGKGGSLHLTNAGGGWLVPGHNPFGLYLYAQNVDELAAAFRGETLGESGAEHKPWGMFEFAVSDPDGTLVRIGWPSRLRTG